MIEIFYRCDLCRKANDDGEEFKNTVTLTANGGTKFIKKVCISCLTLVEEYVLDNQEKYDNRRN